MNVVRSSVVPGCYKSAGVDMVTIYFYNKGWSGSRSSDPFLIALFFLTEMDLVGDLEKVFFFAVVND